MRTALLALATLCFFAGVENRADGDEAAATSNQCQCPKCQQARAEAAAAQQQQEAALQQAALFAQQPMAAGVQQAGFGHPMAAAGCYPGSPCYGGHGFHGHGGHGMHGMHGGYPGGPFHGGHYGYFGGAHCTPGYPHHHLHREYVGPQGPPTANVAYPYYTIRGPRDFLLDNPPSIGR